METAKKVFWLATGIGAVAGGVLMWKHGQPILGALAFVLGAAEVYNVGADLLEQVQSPAASASRGEQAAVAVA